VPHDIKELARHPDRPDGRLRVLRATDISARRLHYGRAKDELRAAELGAPGSEDFAAALHYARTLTLDDGRDAEVYAELKKFYSYSEIIELSAFFCLTAAAIAWLKAGASNLTVRRPRSQKMQCQSMESAEHQLQHKSSHSAKSQLHFERAGAPNKKRGAMIHFVCRGDNYDETFFTRALATGILFGAVLIFAIEQAACRRR